MSKKKAGKPPQRRKVHVASSRKTSPGRDEESAPSLLLAEDKPGPARALKGVFESVGFQVSTARSLAQCIDLLLSRAFDIVVLDMKMPAEPGSEVIEDGAMKILGTGEASLSEIHAMRLYGIVDRDTPIVVVTAYPSIPHWFRCIEAGAYYVPKHSWPGVTEDLAKECHRMVLERRQRREQPRQTWLEKHYSELVKLFPAKTIAVVDQGTAKDNNLTGGTPIEDRLVFAADDREDLRQKIVADKALRRCLPVIIDIPED